MKKRIIISEPSEQQGWNKNTELCVDVKTYLRSDNRMKAGKNYQGVLRRDDGTYNPNFRPIRTGPGFNLERYASGVANELLWALEGLIEEE